MAITRFDHLVLTVCDLDKTCDFYARVLGMKVITFGENRRDLKFGQQKINLNTVEKELEPKAFYTTPGSGDFCLITKVPLEEVLEYLKDCQIEILDSESKTDWDNNGRN